MKAYRVQICNMATDDDISCYFSYPPTKFAILRSLDQRPPSPSIHRCLSVVEDCGDALRLSGGPFPGCLHGQSDSFIEITLIDMDTEENITDHCHRVVDLSRQLRQVSQETVRLSEERRRLTELVRAENDTRRFLTRPKGDPTAGETVLKL